MSPSPAAFPPPAAAVSLYLGKVMHARLRPFGHRFDYRVYSLLIDLGRLSEASRASPLLSVGRFNLLSFHESDHGARDGSSARAHAVSQLAAAGLDIGAGRVLLLCYPRVLGLVFNPLSIYYCYREDGELAALIYEVRNTFGGLHAYVAPVRSGEATDAGVRQARDKTFYVSPFFDMNLRYRFRILPPGERLAVRILETDAKGPIFAATHSGERRDATTANLLRAFVQVPLLTVKVVGAIHWQALKLWLKGAKFHPRPAHAGAVPPSRSVLDRRA